jgi:hypothetical protein
MAMDTPSIGGDANMVAVEENARSREARAQETRTEVEYEAWHHWPVNWSAIWTGTLAALAAVLIFGLIGLAIGATLIDPEHRVVDLRKFGIGTLIWSICSAFFAFVIGGWVTGKVAGILRAEPAMLHGAIAWLVALPLLVVLVALGAGSYFGGWYGGLAGTPAWASSPSLPFDRPEPLAAGASAADRDRYAAEQAQYRQKVQQWKEDTPRVTRNGAIGAVTALLLGLVGSVIGGWMASGEPMTFTYHRTRRNLRTS